MPSIALLIEIIPGTFQEIVNLSVDNALQCKTWPRHGHALHNTAQEPVHGWTLVTLQPAHNRLFTLSRSLPPPIDLFNFDVSEAGSDLVMELN